MKPALKILIWISAGALTALVLLFSISLIKRDSVVDLFIKSINNNISTKIEVGSATFSLINKFPKASVRLENVLIHSSPGFDRTQFRKTTTDTLLSAKSVFLEFKVTDLLKGKYNIERITVKDGVSFLFSDSSGKVNYDIGESSSTSENDFVLNLEQINISDLSLIYVNTATSLDFNGLIKSGRFKSRIDGENIDFSASSSLMLNRIDIFPLMLKTPSSASLDLNLQKSDSGIYFRKGTLTIDNLNFGITGMVFNDEKLNLKITGRNIDISKIKKYLPAGYMSTIQEYNPSGILKIDCFLSGQFDRINNPYISINYSVVNGSVSYKKSNIKLTKLSLSGSFSNGVRRSPETSSLLIDRVNCFLGSAEYAGSLGISNFKHPRIEMIFSGNIIPGELSEFLNLKEVTQLEGSVRANFKLKGSLRLKEKYSISDLMDLNPEGDLMFRSFGMGLKKKNLILTDLNGNIMFSRHLWAEDLSFTYNGQRARVDGEFRNLPGWLAGLPVQIKAKASVSVSSLSLAGILPETDTLLPENNRAFRLPDGLELDISLNIDKLDHKTFSAGNIKGTLLYRPGILSFKSFSLNSMDGIISGDFFLAREIGKSFISRGSFSIEDVNIKKAFYSFKNFGQDFIKGENLAGLLTGKLSLLLPLDSLLNPITRAATAEGKYIVTDGSLNNFEPVKSLSRFIELSELENITFSKLENDFYIRNNYIAIPQMDIRSSAADFTVSGKHDFDNNYEYHVKMYLSEILSKRTKKNKTNTGEFGAIEEDGLGRTSVFLKITGAGEEVKVSYDLKAASGNVKQSLKSEKETLKSILNQEYGWFKNDTTVKQETAPKPRFRIEWEETDTIKKQVDTARVKKNDLLNGIFKKKK